MRNRPECLSAAIRFHRIRCGQRSRFGAPAFAFIAAVLALSCGAFAQNMAMPDAAAPGIDPGAPPMTESGNVSFFSQDLGTILRLRYNTESYGQDGQGNFDIGSMQVVTMDDSAALLDGQVTLNDVNGVGFNLGIGYRWMNFPPYAMDTGRVDGVALWVDGTHTEAGNFFPQIGLSYESLGEMWDIRSNLYVPVGKQDQIGAFKKTGEIGFEGSSIAELTRAIVDSSYTVGEIELARRLGSERDAWAFAGPYFVTNDNDNSAGGRVGVRGYAYPDLLLQFAVSNDDVFHTNATFSLQWFVGRTRTNYQPCGGVPDRLREPFMRNDYVALGKSTRRGGIPLTQPDGSALRIVHVDSSAAPGGDGTFENPYDELSEANGAGSHTGDIIFAHSTSTFDTSIVLKNDQRFLGEGNNLEFMVNTLQEGTIPIPESSPGARALARPMIVTALGDAVTLADNNEVANFDMDGQGTLTRTITAPGAGAGNPNLHHLSIENTVGDGIAFTPATITDPNDATKQIVRGNVTIHDVVFDNVGGNGININSATTTDVTLPTVTLQEAIAISNVTSTNGTGRGINLENTHAGAGHTATLTNYTYDGGATSLGALRMNNIDGTFTASASSLTNGSTAVGTAGVQILGDTDGTLTFQSTFVMNNVNSETSFDINGNDAATDKLNGRITVSNAITNDTGRSVSVQNVAAGAIINFNGNITDTGDGLLVNSNSGGSVTFLGDLAMTIDTPGATAAQVTDNTGASIDFAGDVVINSTSTANGFVATGGGTLSAPSTVNSVSTETGRPVQITGMTIAAAGAHLGDVNRTAAAATNAIQVENNTGGPITVGNTTDSAGDAGTIVGGTVDAIRIVDSSNVSINGLNVNNTSAVAAVHVEKTTSAAMTTNLSDLAITGGAVGVDTVGGGSGAVTMTINDTTVTNPTAEGLKFTGLNAGTVSVNNATLNGGTLAINVSGANSGALNLKLVDSTLNNNAVISLTGAGHFGLLVDNTDINTGNNDVAFALIQSGAAKNADLTFRNGNNFTTGGAQALLIDSSAASGKDVNLLVQDSTFTNNSAGAATADITAEQTSLMNATIQGNTFTNSNAAGVNYNMTSNGAAAFLNLNLGGAGADQNTATGGLVEYHLHELAGSTFSVFDTTNTFNDTRNVGTVVTDPNDAAFTNLVVPPPLPTVPP